jgi:large subunit ribosomal protein L22
MATAPADRTEVKAQARWVRTAPRKAQLVVSEIRGRTVPEARVLLSFMTRAAARDVARVLDSAVANAEANHGLVGDDLYVSAAYVDSGPTLKRWRARARGRVGRIRKRTCHITIRVAPTEEALAQPPAAAGQESPRRARRPRAEAAPQAQAAPAETVPQEAAPEPAEAPEPTAAQEPAEAAKAEAAEEASAEAELEPAAEPEPGGEDAPRPRRTRRAKPAGQAETAGEAAEAEPRERKPRRTRKRAAGDAEEGRGPGQEGDR